MDTLSDGGGTVNAGVVEGVEPGGGIADCGVDCD